MKYFKKIKKRKERVRANIPTPVPFFKKPTLPRIVFFEVSSIIPFKEPILFLS